MKQQAVIIAKTPHGDFESVPQNIEKLDQLMKELGELNRLNFGVTENEFLIMNKGMIDRSIFIVKKV